MNFAFDSVAAFMQMGQHGFYVWLCYGLTLLTFVANVLMFQWKKKQIIADMQAEQRRKQKQQENPNSHHSQSAG